MMWMRWLAVSVFIFEVLLSHTTGDRSGAESRWLSERVHVSERALRRGAHVCLFAILSAMSGLAFGRFGIAATAVWSLLDEVTKIPIPGRHFSWFDVGLNLCGCAIGAIVWLLVYFRSV